MSMFRDFFEELQTELMGIGLTVEIGVPNDPKEEKEELIIYLSFVNIENIDRQTNYARIRVLITAFIGKDKLGDHETNLDALEALDDIINYLDDNKRSYNLVATPESTTNNIWSAFKITLRPFLMYECPVGLS